MASMAERAVDKAAELTGSALGGALHATSNVVGGIADKVLAGAAEVAEESLDPIDLQYGLGDAPEASRARRFDAVSAISHGARRVGNQQGLGAAGLKFAGSLLYCGATAAFLMGSVMFLEAGAEMSLAKATAGDILYLLCFALWISRGCIRLADAIKGDRERALIKPLNRRPTREVDLRSTLSGLRYTALVLEIAGAASCFLGCLAFFFTSKTQGVAPYVMWLLGCLCLLASAYTDHTVTGEVWMSSKCLPGHTQRMRSFVEMACGDGEILAHAFLVAGAVQWLAWQFRSAHIFSLIGGILLTGPCIGDVAAALESSTLQYTDACSVLAAQVQLDMQAPPTGPGIEGAPGVSGVMDRVLMAQPTRRHPEPRTYIEAAQHFVPAVAAKFE